MSIPPRSRQPTAAILFVFGGRRKFTGSWLHRALASPRLWLGAV